MRKTGDARQQAHKRASVVLQDKVNQAMALHQQGRLAEAAHIYREVLQQQPNHFHALHLLGIIAFQTRHTERAVELISKAIGLNPSVAAAHYDLGIALNSINRPDEALASFDKAIALKPDYVEAYNNRGNALLGLKRPEDAVVSYDRAIALKGDYADAHNNRGVALKDLKRPDEALASCDKAIALKSDYAEAHNNRGNLLLDLKRFEEAVASYDNAIALKPDFAEAYNNRGTALRKLKRLEEAVASYNQAIALRPNFAEAWCGRGDVFGEFKRYDEAFAAYDKALAFKPNLAEAWLGRGNVFFELKRRNEALTAYDKALSLKRDLAGAWLGRGNVFSDLKRHDDAFAAYDKALALNPDLAEAWLGRGSVFHDLKRLDEAFAAFNEAIAIKPDCAGAYAYRGIVFQELMQLDAAVANYDKAIAIKPDYADAYWNKSLALLLRGEFDEGWKLFEWRWQARAFESSKTKYPQPLWLGNDALTGKTILLCGEQGFGDTIQFCRYVRLVADLGARVILQVPEQLMSLLANLSGVAQLVGERSPLPLFDYQCPLLSLPLAFKTTLSSIPANIPYLSSNAEKSLFWKGKLGEKNKLRVGLVWSGGFRLNQPEVWSVNSRRNIPLARLAALKHPDVEFYSLQKGELAESELAELIRENWDGPDIFDFSSLLNDFSDTAALAENLDLVISVDTSTAHLAGALGKPVWVLNRFDTDWRWLLDRTDSPWYPTVKLYRQKKAGDWDDVVQRVKMDLICFHGSEGN